MSVYNLANCKGKTISLIKDADGIEWHDVVEVDTDTGRIVRLKRNSEGRFYIDPDNPEQAAREVVFAPTPIRLKIEDVPKLSDEEWECGGYKGAKPRK